MTLLPYNKGDYDPLQAMELLKRVDTCVEEVKKATAVLPRINSSGHSECHFAEDLHARKEHWQRELQVQYGQLHEFRAAAAAEVKRYARNRDAIESSRERLHGEEAKAKYGEMENQLEAEAQLHLRMRRRLEDKIKLVEQVLATASANMFPRRRPQSSQGPSASSMPPTSAPSQRCADSELSDLIAIDRERRAGGPFVPVRKTEHRARETRNAPGESTVRSSIGNRWGAPRGVPGVPGRL